MKALIIKDYPTGLVGLANMDLYVEVANYSCDKNIVQGMARSYQSNNGVKNGNRVLDFFALPTASYDPNTRSEVSLLTTYKAEKEVQGFTVEIVV